MINLD